MRYGINYGHKKVFKYSLGASLMEKKNLSNLNTRGQCYNTFLSIIYEFLKRARVFVLGKLFYPIVINTLAQYENSKTYGQKVL